MSNLCETLDEIEKTLDEMDCPEPSQPYVTCCMITPPPILAPTKPEPVKPLQLPCPQPPRQPQLTEEERMELRYDNYYNNYNIPWNAWGQYDDREYVELRKDRCKGVTLDGKDPCLFPKCQKIPKYVKGCPTGFKPCHMLLRPPPGNHPCGVWCAEVVKCPKPPAGRKPWEVDQKKC